MNPDQPSREQIEARITALLLGELPAAEAELLRWTISRDPELQKLHDQLKVTIGFVHDAMKNPTGAPLEREIPLKLPQERRQTLLAHFKTARPLPPRKLSWLKRIEISSTNSLVAAAVIILVICGLAAISIPNFVKSRATSQENACINNLRQIDAAKQEWALEKHMPADAAPTANDLTPYLAGGTMRSVAGENYVLGTVSEPTVAEFNGKRLTASKGSESTTFALNASLPNTHTEHSITRNMRRPGAAVNEWELETEKASGSVNSADLNPQEPKIPSQSVQPAPIALPNTETSENDKERGAVFSQNVVGYVNVAPPTTAYVQVLNQLEPQPKTETSHFGLSASSPPPPQAETASTFAQGGTATQPSPLSAPVPAEFAENANAEMPSAPPPSAAAAQPEIVNAPTSELVPPPPTAGDERGGEGNGQPASVPHEIRNTAPIRGELSTVGTLASSKQENPSAGLALMPPRLRGQYLQRNGTFSSAQAPFSVPVTAGSGGMASAAPESAASSQLGPVLPVPIAGTYKTFICPPDSSPSLATNSEQLANGSAELNRELNDAMRNLQAQTKSVSGAAGSASGAIQNGFMANYPYQVPPGSTANAVAMDQAQLQNGQVLTWSDQMKKGPSASQAATPMALSPQQQYAQNLQTLDKDRITEADMPLAPAPATPAVPQPEILTQDNAFSTFSLNVSDVSFKLAMASLQKGQMPVPASIRSEEFINAFDYHDPEPLQGEPLAFTSERASDPFAHERDILRFSVKAAAAGRQDGRALNLVLLLDTSGSMERADRVAIIREMLRVLSSQLQRHDVVSVVTFARTARLWADGIPGDAAGATLDKVGSITPEGGTNLEEAMRLAYETALRHFIAGGMNRVVLLTDGAANLGNVDPQSLTQKVDTERRQGIALDCFGIGWDDYNDDLLEQLSSNGDGRYAFINSPDEAATEFVTKLAGALQVAAEDVKVQVEFNPSRVTAWRQIGYAKHQLTKQQFRDNTVAAGAIAAREAGNALYVIETNPNGEGPIATVRVRYRVPGTQNVNERSWSVDYTGAAPDLAQSSPAMRLAATAAETAEWLSDSPFAQDVTPDELLNYLSGVPQVYGTDERPKQLEWMIREAKSVSGK
jgi:Mg-chelatase subunit ChlD